MWGTRRGASPRSDSLLNNPLGGICRVKNDLKMGSYCLYTPIFRPFLHCICCFELVFQQRGRTRRGAAGQALLDVVSAAKAASAIIASSRYTVPQVVAPVIPGVAAGASGPWQGQDRP